MQKIATFDTNYEKKMEKSFLRNIPTKIDSF